MKIFITNYKNSIINIYINKPSYIDTMNTFVSYFIDKKHDYIAMFDRSIYCEILNYIDTMNAYVSLFNNKKHDNIVMFDWSTYCESLNYNKNDLRSYFFMNRFATFQKTKCDDFFRKCCKLSLVKSWIIFAIF